MRKSNEEEKSRKKREPWPKSMTAKERSESTGMESGQQWREMTKEMERDVKRTVSEFPRRSKKVPCMGITTQANSSATHSLYSRLFFRPTV